MKRINMAASTILLLITFHYGNSQFADPKLLIDALRDKGIKTVGYPEFKSGFINASLAKRMSAKYKNDPAKSKVYKTNQPDARAIWFDMEKLDNFITKIKRSTADKSMNLKLGIRIYYVLYPDTLFDPGLRDLSKLVAGKHSLIMVPTYYDKRMNMNVDFSFMNVGNGDLPIPYYKIIDDHTLDTAIFSISQSFMYRLSNTTASHVAGADPTASIENHGGLSPPPENGGSFPTPSSAKATNILPKKP